MLWSILRSVGTIIVQSSLSSRYVTNWTLQPWTMFSNVADRSNWTSHTMGGLVTSSCVIAKMLFVVIHVLEKNVWDSLNENLKNWKGPLYYLSCFEYWYHQKLCLNAGDDCDDNMCCVRVPLVRIPNCDLGLPPGCLCVQSVNMQWWDASRLAACISPQRKYLRG